MATTVTDIRRWLNEGKKAGATHVVVLTDTFDWTDYPHNVMPGESVNEFVAAKRNANMTAVTEVYALHLDWDSQLSERRAFHYEYPEAS